ncbi:hypothetical protein MKX07_006726 [Trichoderma sp. CBMAI-0711]|nr:hypothetical protein MKX07_006726 [Trichoderma sp. CBMAI-0711]
MDAVLSKGMATSQFAHPVEIVGCRIARLQSSVFYTARQDDGQPRVNVGAFMDRNLANLNS